MNKTWLGWTAIVLSATAIVACKKNYPAPYDDIGLSREGLASAFTVEHGVTGLYDKPKTAGEVADDCEKGLSEKGYKRICEHKFEDKSLLRGYKKDASHRFLMSAGELGKAGPEITVIDVPDKVADDDVCATSDDAK